MLFRSELWIITEQNAYLQRPGIWKSGEVQPWSNGYCREMMQNQHWDPRYWAVFTDIDLAVEYARVWGVTPLRGYGCVDEMRLDLHHDQPIVWAYNRPSDIATRPQQELERVEYPTVEKRKEANESKLDRIVKTLRTANG